MSWQFVVTLIALVQGAFVLGISIIILIYFFKNGARAAIGYRQTLHVIFIAASYIGLTLITLRGVHKGIFFPPHSDWFVVLPGLMLFYFLGDYALWQMFEHHKEKH